VRRNDGRRTRGDDGESEGGGAGEWHRHGRADGIRGNNGPKSAFADSLDGIVARQRHGRKWEDATEAAQGRSLVWWNIA
jgi:hypothetical protein